MRRRLGWLLIVRLGLVSLFLAVAALVYRPHATETLDPRLGLIALGYGVTAISGLFLGRVRREFSPSQACNSPSISRLVSLVILVTGGLDSPLAVLYNVVILNAALLGLGTWHHCDRGRSGRRLRRIDDDAGARGTRRTADGCLHLQPYHRSLSRSWRSPRSPAISACSWPPPSRSSIERQAEIGRIETLQSLVANTLDHGLVTTDGSGRVQTCNPDCRRGLGHASRTVGASRSTRACRAPRRFRSAARQRN